MPYTSSIFQQQKDCDKLWLRITGVNYSQLASFHFNHLVLNTG